MKLLAGIALFLLCALVGEGKSHRLATALPFNCLLFFFL